MEHKNKIVILGSGGAAGHVITTHLTERGYEVINISGRKRANKDTILLDLTNTELFEKFLDKNEFDIIINCAGILIAESEKRKDLSAYINSFLPHFLENKYSGTSTRIIHLSTDCVFSGQNPPYKENSSYDGTLFYDRSKALGEIINKKDLTFRMSIIGPDRSTEGIGLFNWFMKQDGTSNGFTRAYWTGVTTIELAKGIEAAIQQNLTGLYHFVPDQNISKYELLHLFKSVFGKNNILIEPQENALIDKTLINTRKDFKYQIPDYVQMVIEMREWILNHKDFYPQYF